MRTLQEIQASMKADYVSNTTVRSRYSITDPEATFDGTFSAFSIEAIIIYVVSLAIYSIEYLQAQHLVEVNNREDQMRIGTIAWWREICKSFQYGHELAYDETTYLFKYATDDSSARVIKFAEVREGVGAGVSILVNLEDSEGNPEAIPAESPIRAAFASYLGKVKIAGMPLSWGSYNPDQLKLTLNVVYDPLVMDGSGALIIEETDPIAANVAAYLRALPYGSGTINKTALLNVIEQTEGVIDVYADDNTWLKVSTDDTPAFTAVEGQNLQSYGGSFVLAETAALTINYIANV